MNMACRASLLARKVEGVALALAVSFLAIQPVLGQSIRVPWSGFAHTPQHDGISAVPSQPLNKIKWSAPVVKGVPVGFAHFSGPLVTRSNTVIFPMNLTNTGYDFKIEAVDGGTGKTNWERPTDFTGLAGAPVVGLALTPKNRLFFAGIGATVLYCDSPDAKSRPLFTREAFFGTANYTAHSKLYNSNVFICTPLTVDRYGDIFFGYRITGPTPLGSQGGLARIDYTGKGSWISASNAITVSNSCQPGLNCAPALSIDQKTVYMAFVSSELEPAYLVAMDSRTLAPKASVRLADPVTGTSPNVAYSPTSSPTIGPDGDVYFGILGSADSEGWLLHFDGTLSVSKIPGGFGWDTTDAIVDASLVPNYSGNSKYLLATKYNMYDSKRYSMALLDPQQGVVSSNTFINVMATVLSVPSPTGLEWCVNAPAVDPFTKSVLMNNEDGNLYRWDITRNQLTESIGLTAAQSVEAYTPTVIGVDGTVYAINHGYLFAVGQ
ncbi:MAG TPA: hypothetical protein VGO67_14050 [Verrucomicrobiae bacterium]|jgi:hypothetical protein